jgi:hypothetical protein
LSKNQDESVCSELWRRRKEGMKEERKEGKVGTVRRKEGRKKGEEEDK